jgi:L-lactate dehydrogenase complex protein LldG
MAISAAGSSAREEVLRRIRVALGGSRTALEAINSEWAGLDRSYKRAGELSHDAVLEQLEDRLRDYDAHVERAISGDLKRKIAELLSARGVRTLVVPEGLANAIGAELPEGFEFVIDERLDAAELDKLQGVVTGCTVAISQTGTLVLQNVPGQGRRAPTLVPDYHLCIVRESDVVETVPEAMARLEPTALLATTFISGPSATADIEMTRVKGVHGPRFLDVILVRSGADTV